MKNVITTLMLTAVSISGSATTITCPEIQGYWNCDGTSVPQKIDIIKNNKHYSLEILEDIEEDYPKTTFILDGKQHDITTGHYTAVCSAKSVLVAGTQFFDAKKKDNPFTVKFAYTLVNPDLLTMGIIESNANAFAPNQKPSVCKRISPSELEQQL